MFCHPTTYLLPQIYSQEMVGAAGPLRNGDEVDIMLPTPMPEVPPQKPKGKNLAGSGHAVGAVRVQASEHRTI